MVVEGSCSGSTIGKSSWSDLADADGAYMQTPYVINGRHLTRLTRQGRSSEEGGAYRDRYNSISDEQLPPPMQD